MKFPWNRHFYMLKTKQRNHTAPAAGGLQKIQEVKAEVQISRLVVKLAMVYDGDLTMKSPWNSHEITSLWGGEFHGRCNDGDFMGFEWRFFDADLNGMKNWILIWDWGFIGEKTLWWLYSCISIWCT